MVKYHFPFQRILEVREKEKENAQLNMAKAIQKQERIESRIEELFHKISDTREQLQDRQAHGVTINELKWSEFYVNQLQQRITVEQSQLSFAKKNVEKRQEVLWGALKEEKTWFSLKEKKEFEYSHQLKTIEQSQIDEISTQLFFRNRG
jgi:flagellar FliJ protein